MLASFFRIGPTERIKRAEPPDPAVEHPMVVAASVSGGWRICWRPENMRAKALGVVPGELLADVRARIGTLDIREADPDADREARAKLAHWSTRFWPTVAPWKEDLHFERSWTDARYRRLRTSVRRRGRIGAAAARTLATLSV